MSKPILCVDWDGVIHSYTSGWQGAGVIIDPPVPGALTWLWMASQSFSVQIYSSRSSLPGGIEAMMAYVREHAARECAVHGLYRPKDLLDVLAFPDQKPAAFLTIDDRAICFDGDWSKLDPQELLKFKPWNKR